MKCTALCFILICFSFFFLKVDGGTAWMARESMLLETDAVDSSSAVGPWWDLAQQLKQDMASIILMSEADLQVPTLSTAIPIPACIGTICGPICKLFSWVS